MTEKYYLRVATFHDLKEPGDRFLYRFFEMLPGFLLWGTFFLAVLLSWLAPFVVAFFIIAFDLYWLFRVIYFSVHLRAAYQKMRLHEKIDWKNLLEELKPEQIKISNLKSWQEIYHLIVIPMFKEPWEVVRELFLSLVNSDYPREKMIVVLSYEEKAKIHGERVALRIKEEFSDKFFKLAVFCHPANIPGEISGKGSNETFAAIRAKEEIIDKLPIAYERIIFSSFDADTVVLPKYFSCLTYHYLTCEKPLRTSYQPIPLYVNNLWQVPIFSRIFAFSSTFWHTLNQERPEKLVTFSSHSMSFQALVEVGFKQTNVVSDDSRIFWQCFLYFDGDYRVLPLYYPVSMDAIGARSFWATLKNLYRQQRRWAFGVGEIPYVFFGFLKNKKIPFSRKLSLVSELLESHWSWASASFLIFFLGWLPLVLGSQKFSQTILSYKLPQLTSLLMTFSMIGLLLTAFLSLKLLPPRPPDYGRHKYFVFVIQWLFLPLMMLFFSALPAIDAQTRWLLGKYLGFWHTEKLR